MGCQGWDEHSLPELQLQNWPATDEPASEGRLLAFGRFQGSCGRKSEFQKDVSCKNQTCWKNKCIEAIHRANVLQLVTAYL